jgi:hypothetical protein
MAIENIVENIVEMGVLLLVMTYPQNKNIPLAQIITYLGYIPTIYYLAYI